MTEGRNAPATVVADEPAAMEQQDRSQDLRDLAVAASSKTFLAGAAILLFWEAQEKRGSAASFVVPCPISCRCSYHYGVSGARK